MNRRTLHPWRLAVVFVGLASLAACGPPLEWYKEGVTPSQYAVDLRYCKGAEDLVASYTPDDLMYSLPLDEIETYNACMYERGYRLIEAGQPAPGR